jgi:hypothetical protein
MLNNQMTPDKLVIQTSTSTNSRYAYMKPQNKFNNSKNKNRSHPKPSLSTGKSDEEKDKVLPTPPSSPEATPRTPIQQNTTANNNNKKKVSSTYEYNNRILAAKRSGNIRVVINEFISMKKNSVQMTHHTYNLVLESHAILRREGTPLTTMLKSNKLKNYIFLFFFFFTHTFYLSSL